MITVAVLGDDGKTLIHGGEELLDRPGLKWVDVESQDETLLSRLAERFSLHKLAVEDCLHLDQRPKLEEYPQHHFLVLQGFTSSPQDATEVTLHELHCFVGKDFVISVHEHPLPALQDARKRITTDPANTFARGPDFITYCLADALVDSNFPVVEALTGVVEELEEELFERTSQDQLQKMFEVKRTIVTLRRVLSPQRDVLAILVRGGGFVQERTTLYFRDVYDHLIRLHEQLDTARELVANARDAYLNATANRTNDVTKQLTIFATIFLPLSFITGFFGQNFDVLSQPVFFWSMLLLVFLLPVLLLAWFRYKRWI